VVPANVEKCAQNAIVPMHDNDRFARDVGRNVLAGLLHLVYARRELPRVGKDRF
jgi:hypothetical protein